MEADAPRIWRGWGVGLCDLGPKRRNGALMEEERAVNRSAIRNVRSALGIIISRHCSCLRAEANRLTNVIHAGRQERSGRVGSGRLSPRAQIHLAPLNPKCRASPPALGANPIPVPGTVRCARRLLL